MQQLLAVLTDMAIALPVIVLKFERSYLVSVEDKIAAGA